MPQLKTANPAGPQSTVPYFTYFKGIICFGYDTLIFTHVLLKWLEIFHQTVLFPPKVNQHNEPRSKLSKSY